MACTNQNTSFVVGLTGSIASGKSTCASYFQELGATVHDADAIAKQLLAPNTPAWRACIDHFGSAIMTTDGQLDRKKLGHHIFNHPKAKQWLEQLLHPTIRQRLVHACQQPTPTYHILMVPLLQQSPFHYPIHRCCVVVTSRKIQIERAMQRDHATRQDIETILQHQANPTIASQHADDLINNNGSLAHLKQHVARLHREYLKHAEMPR